MAKKILLVVLIATAFCSSALLAQTKDSVSVKDTAKNEGMNPKAAKYFNQALGFYQQKNNSQTLLYLDSAEAVVKDYRFSDLRGNVLFDKGNYQAAIQSFKAAIGLKADYAPAYNSIGDAYSYLTDYDNAIVNYEKFLTISNNDKMKETATKSIADAKNNKAVDLISKGNALLDQQKYEEALALYNRSLSAKEDFGTYYQIGIAQGKLNRYNEAVSAYEKSLTLKKDYKTYFQLALAYQKLEKSNETVKAFQDCIAANDSFSTAYTALATHYLTHKNNDKALEVLNDPKFKVAAENVGSVAYYKALCYVGKKDKKKAIEQLKIASSDPRFGQSAKALLKKVQEGGKTIPGKKVEIPPRSK